MSTEKSYNGWFNYETWQVNLWLDNDEGSQEHWREAAEEAFENAEADAILTRTQRATYSLAKQLKDEIEEANPLADQSNMWSDMLSGALSEVNWDEIAAHYIDDHKPAPKPGNVFCTVEEIGGGQCVVTLTETGHSFPLSTDYDRAAFAVNCGAIKAPKDWEGLPSTLAEWDKCDIADITECSDEYTGVAKAVEA